MAEKKENNFLVKIDKVRKKSYAGFMLLKQDDVWSRLIINLYFW